MENEGKNVFNNSILVIPFHIFTILEKSHFYHLKITHAVYMQYTCFNHKDEDDSQNTYRSFFF